MPAERLRAQARIWADWLHHCTSLRVFWFYRPGPGPMLMSQLRRWWVRWRNPHVRLVFEGRAYLGPGFSLDAPHGGTFIVGPDVEFRRGFRAELGGPSAEIRIGAATVFTYDVILLCSTSMTIGRHCGIGQASILIDGNHRYFDDLVSPPLQQGYDYRPLTIADFVSITGKATILANIGTRTVVGANAVVTRPMPAYCVVGGVPARVISYHGPEQEVPPELADPASSPR